MAALGLLAQQPGSGYDLLKTFEKSMANVWPATQSQLYGELNKLADAGLIEVTDIGPRGRKEYRITAGRARRTAALGDEPRERPAVPRRLAAARVPARRDRTRAGPQAHGRGGGACRRRGRSDSRSCATPSTGPTATACSSAAPRWSTACASMRWKREWARWVVERTRQASHRSVEDPVRRPEARRIPVMHRPRWPRPIPIYRITHRLQRRTLRPDVHAAARSRPTVSAWLAEFGVAVHWSTT